MRIVIAAALLGVLVTTLSAPAARDGFDEGMAVYERGDYATALGEVRPLAEQGLAKAQFVLGIMYDYGRGVPQEYAEAVKWYRKAAVQGVAVAQDNLGAMYKMGRGVPQDYAEAVKWFRKAAEQGYAGAFSSLGLMYGLGHGVPQDYILAHMWFNLAASRLPEGKDRDRAVMLRDKTADTVMTPTQIAEAQIRAGEWKPCGKDRPCP